MKKNIRTITNFYIVLLLSLLSNTVTVYSDFMYVPRNDLQYGNVYQLGQNSFFQIGCHDWWHPNPWDNWPIDPEQPINPKPINNTSTSQYYSNKAEPLLNEACEFIYEAKYKPQGPANSSLNDLKRINRLTTALSDKLQVFHHDYYEKLDPEAKQKLDFSISEVKKEQDKIDSACARARDALNNKIDDYDAHLHAMSTEQQCSELARINQELESYNPQYLGYITERDKCHKEITAVKENIKFYKSGSWWSRFLLLCNPDKLDDLESELRTHQEKERDLDQKIGEAKKDIELLDTQRTNCQTELANRLNISLARIQDMTSEELYAFEQETIQLAQIAKEEEQRTTKEMQKKGKSSGLYSKLSSNHKKAQEAYTICENAHQQAYNAIGQRLYTQEYKNNLQELSTELHSHSDLTQENQEFLGAVDSTLQHQEHPQLTLVESKLDQASLDWIKEQGVNPAEFARYYGDEVGQYIFKRNVAILHGTKDLTQKYPDKPIVIEYGKAVVNFSSAAIDASKAGQVEEAHQLTDVADTINKIAEIAAYSIVGLEKGPNYEIAKFAVCAAIGFVEGTIVDGATGIYNLIFHPIQTTQALAAGAGKFATFLVKTNMFTPDNLRSFEAQREADNAWLAVSEEFLQLPLHEKGRLCGKIGSLLWGPGLVAKGAKLVGAIPKVQAGMAAIGRIVDAEQAALRSFMLKTAAGTMLAANVETAELVTLGGKVMSAELAETILQTYNKIGSSMPLVDFVEAFENSVMPATAFLDKTFQKVAEPYSHHPLVHPREQRVGMEIFTESNGSKKFSEAMEKELGCEESKLAKYNLNKTKLEKYKAEILAGQKDLTHLKRTFKFHELTIEMKSGHSYFREHSGGYVSEFASLNEIEAKIIDDFIERLENVKTNQIDLIQEGFTEHLSIFINGYEIEYEPFRQGNFYSFDYYPKTRKL